MDTPTTPHGRKWSDFITTLQELATEIRQEQGTLRAARNEALLDYAGHHTLAGRAMLDVLTEQIVRKRAILADWEETLAEAKQQTITEPPA
jgi:hypothetical protein